jgi:hypothetical protein
MALHTDLAAGLIVGAFAIGHGPMVLAETIVQAKTWDEAITKLECKDIHKNPDGSYSVKAVVKVNYEVQHNPIINVEEYRTEVEAKNCEGLK